MSAVFLISDHDLVDDESVGSFKRRSIFFIARDRVFKAGGLPLSRSENSVVVAHIRLVRFNVRILNAIDRSAVGTRKDHRAALRGERKSRMYLAVGDFVPARAENVYVLARADSHVGKSPRVRRINVVRKFVTVQADRLRRRVPKFYPVRRLPESVRQTDVVFRSDLADDERIVRDRQRREIRFPAVRSVREKRSYRVINKKLRPLAFAVHRLSAFEKDRFDRVNDRSVRRHQTDRLTAFFGKLECRKDLVIRARVPDLPRTVNNGISVRGQDRSVGDRPHGGGRIDSEPEA